MRNPYDYSRRIPMVSREELSGLRARHSGLERRIGEVGVKQLPATLRLASTLQELIEEVEATQEREQDPRNQALHAKIKVVKYGIKLSKKLNYFEEEIVREFDRGNLTKGMGRKFVSITKHVREQKMQAAKEEFRYFQEIIDLNQEYMDSASEIRGHARALRARKREIKNMLEALSWMEAQPTNPEKLRKYEELQESLEELGRLRAGYIHSLCSMPVAELLGDASIRDLLPPLPQGESAELKKFFSDYPAIGKSGVTGICGMLGFSEKKISHLCPETSRFRKLVLGNKGWFEAMRILEQSGFLALGGASEKMLDFYAENVPGAEKAAARARLLGREKESLAEEYEKSRKIGQKRKELSGRSREGLEAELEDASSLLGFLESKPAGETQNKRENPGLLSRLSSFFKA
jgi:hypothetical protein